MKRFIIAAYGGACYLIFLLTFVYMIAFVGNLVAPKTIDAGEARVPSQFAVFIDLGLLALFGLHHSLMARGPVKSMLARFMPRAMERSTYVLLASLLLLLLAWQWRPIAGVIWEARGSLAVMIWLALFWLGWLIVLISTFLINHFELFGLQQVYFNLIGKRPAQPRFKTPWLYKLVRHPMMLGMLIAFWATPRMSAGHLLFAAGMTAYILAGIWFEERDLVRDLGEAYVTYQRQTPMLLPLARPNPEPSSTPLNPWP